MTDSSTWGAAGSGQPEAMSAESSFGQSGYAVPDQAAPEQAMPGQAAPGYGTMSEQLAYQRGQQDAVRRLTTPRMTGWRIACGITWGIYAIVFFVGGIASFGSGGAGTGLFGLVLAGLAAWYDYRIWTLKARRLMLFIFF